MAGRIQGISGQNNGLEIDDFVFARRCRPPETLALHGFGIAVFGRRRR